MSFTTEAYAGAHPEYSYVLIADPSVQTDHYL